MSKEKRCNNEKLSLISKQALFKCYRLVIEYLRSDNVLEDARFCDLIRELNLYELLIPKDVFDSFREYVFENIAPISEVPEKLFDMSKMHLYSKLSIRERNDEFIENMFVIAHITEDFKDFAMHEFQPLLLS